MNKDQLLESLSWVAPEIILAGFIMLVILVDLVPRLRRGTPWLVALAGLALSGFMAWVYFRGNGELPSFLGRSGHPTRAPLAVFQGAYAVDGFSFFLKIAFTGAAFLVALFSIPATRGWKSGRGEYLALLLSCTLGMTLMASANDLLMMYLALEFVSITSYILAGMLRKNRKSAEASLKYIIYGAAASGFMIYGMSFLYGLTGTLEVSALGRALADKAAAHQLPATMSLITSVLIMAGFAYKIAAVPFHMWCPDVYEGAPTPVTAFFSVGPKAAGFAMLIRFLYNVFPDEGVPGAFPWKLVIALLAVLTMAVGNLGAVHQQNLKRLLAYSSIAHAGYMLVAFVSFTEQARAAVLAYLFVYVIMNLGAFLVVLILEQKYGVETVDGCRGLGWRAPYLGVLMTVFMVALTGLPPTAGFTGKLLLFAAVIETKSALGISLVAVAVLFSVVSLYYYARIVAALYLAKPREGDASEPVPAGGIYASVVGLLGAGTLWFGIFWNQLQGMTADAARNFLK